MKKSLKFKYLPVYLKKILWLLVFAAYSIPCAGESIAIVTISTKNRVSFSQYTLSSLMKYASKWGYHLYFYPDSPPNSYNIYWGKISVLVDLLKEAKHDWYVWIDDDIFITDPEVSIEKLIKDYAKQAHFIIASHKTNPVSKGDVNSGVFLVKNSDWSRMFFQELWDYGSKKPKGYWEQSAISELITSDKYKDSAYIERVSGRKIQSILTLLFKGDHDDYGQWEPGDFAAHLAGACEGVRVRIFEQFASNSKVYPVLPDGFDSFTIAQEPNPTYFSELEIQKTNAEKSLNSGKSAISYDLSGGRFGDNLLAYLHAKWISYKYKIPLLYCPFKYSDQLILSEAELLKSFYKANKTEWLVKNSTKINPNDGTLYMTTWFPESLQEYEPVDHGFFYFNVNWDDEEFIKEVRKLISPRVQLNLLQIPRDKISVALHVRKNSNGFDAPASFEQGQQGKTVAQYFDDRFPLKCINDNFYINGIKKIHELFKGQSLYVYIFTDDNNPRKIAEKYQRALNEPSIVIDYRHDTNNHEINVLEDFFSMLKFDCLIRSDSHFSLVASKLGNYKVVISPAGYTTKNSHPKIVRANISTKIEDV